MMTTHRDLRRTPNLRSCARFGLRLALASAVGLAPPVAAFARSGHGSNSLNTGTERIRAAV